VKSTLTSKGQITIPIQIRRRLNLKPGQVLEFDPDAPFLKATKVFEPGEMYAVVGCARARSPADSSTEWLDKTRGKADLPPKKNANRD
jgi:AbrB family looped-hinge helix DNA binding protein